MARILGHMFDDMNIEFTVREVAAAPVPVEAALSCPG
jgi:hypothetical protein